MYKKHDTQCSAIPELFYMSAGTVSHVSQNWYYISMPIGITSGRASFCRRQAQRLWLFCNKPCFVSRRLMMFSLLMRMGVEASATVHQARTGRSSLSSALSRLQVPEAHLLLSTTAGSPQDHALHVCPKQGPSYQAVTKGWECR